MCGDRELGSFTHYFHLRAAQRRGYRLLTACLPDSIHLEGAAAVGRLAATTLLRVFSILPVGYLLVTEKT
jgi:hypothetical protein